MDSDIRFQVRVRTRRGGGRNFEVDDRDAGMALAQHLVNRGVVVPREAHRGPQEITQIRLIRWVPDEHHGYPADWVRITDEWRLEDGRLRYQDRERHLTEEQRGRKIRVLLRPAEATLS